MNTFTNVCSSFIIVGYFQIAEEPENETKAGLGTRNDMKKVIGVQVLFHDRKSMNAAPWKQTMMSEIYSCQTSEAETLKYDTEEEEQQSVQSGFSRVRVAVIAS